MRDALNGRKAPAGNRDDRGRFRKGHTVKSPGRPSLAAELPMADGIKAAASAEDVAQVLEKMRNLALGGDVKAATLYLAYVLGKPKEFLDITSNGKPVAIAVTKMDVDEL
jgi:hypothetical protein